jgi:hypothetical protein
MKIPPELMPVLQITLPIVLAIFGAAWLQNKRLDDIVARLTAIEGELRETRKVLAAFGERITRLEERIPPLVRR